MPCALTWRDRMYSWLPLYHDMGLIACFMLPMICHVPVVMQSPIDWVMQPESLLQIIAESRCTLAWMPNFAFQFVPRRTPAEALGGLRSLLASSSDQLLRTGTRQQHARISNSIQHRKWRAAVLLRDGRKCFRGDAIGYRCCPEHPLDWMVSNIAQHTASFRLPPRLQAQFRLPHQAGSCRINWCELFQTQERRAPLTWSAKLRQE